MKGNILGKIGKKIVSVFSKKSEVSREQKMKIVEIGYTGDLHRILNKCDLAFLQDVSSEAYIIFCSNKKHQEFLKNADCVVETKIRRYQGFKIYGQVDKVIQRLEEIFGKKIEY